VSQQPKRGETVTGSDSRGQEEDTLSDHEKIQALRRSFQERRMSRKMPQGQLDAVPEQQEALEANTGMEQQQEESEETSNEAKHRGWLSRDKTQGKHEFGAEQEGSSEVEENSNQKEEPKRSRNDTKEEESHVAKPRDAGHRDTANDKLPSRWQLPQSKGVPRSFEDQPTIVEPDKKQLRDETNVQTKELQSTQMGNDERDGHHEAPQQRVRVSVT
jgi:hypothetical protein